MYSQLCRASRCSGFGGAAAATPPKQLQRFILTDYLNNYKFSKLKQYAPWWWWLNRNM